MEVLALFDVALVVIAISDVVINEELGLVTLYLPCILQGFLEQGHSFCVILYLNSYCTHLDQRFYLDLIQLRIRGEDSLKIMRRVQLGCRSKRSD